MTQINTTLYAKASKELEKIIQAELDRPDDHIAFAAIMSSGTPSLGEEYSVVQ